MGALAVPILPGKAETWETWVSELNGARKADFDDMNQRFGLTGHRAWLEHTPDGQDLVIAVHDGPGADDFMGKLAASDVEFDGWFRGKIAEIHGIDFAGAMPPMPEQRL